MKFNFLLLASLAIQFSCSTQPSDQSSKRQVANVGDRLNCANAIDVSLHKGKTYLAFMQDTVKPELDKYATDGYVIASEDTIKDALDNVHKKVKSKATGAAKGKGDLLDLVKELQGKTTTMYTLPNEIAAINKSVDRFTLSTFFGLASCGGAILKYSEGNYAYNIHYGTGKVAKDPQTGRSFGASVDRMANDASDSAYLNDLESFTRNEDDLNPFFKTLMEALLNTDTAGYPTIEMDGQALLTDFLAVYTAEEDRNLMDGKITPHWDAALLEVTLLSSFHAGQESIKMFFADPNLKKQVFTGKTLEQAPGGEPRTEKKDAGLVDYWQFSSRTEKEYKNRSGINITRNEFRKLGTVITAYELKHNKKLVTSLQKAMKGSYAKDNLFLSLSQFLINPKTKKELGNKGYTLAANWTKFLEQVRKDAPLITQEIEAGELGAAAAGAALEGEGEVNERETEKPDDKDKD